jgi:phosphoglycerol geranylgeranyltransferase
MITIYKDILAAKREKQKLLAILLDPDKINWDNLTGLIHKINESPATHLFVGGSSVATNATDKLVLALRKKITLPIVLFPGSSSQISNAADGILFLTLLSGRNPDYLIEHQVQAAPILKQTNLEIMSTGYLLIESGHETAVARVSKTNPMDRTNCDLVVATAQAGEMLGCKLIYLEAGSGAQQIVPLEMIEVVANNISIPLIVGGGIVDLESIQKAYDSGADLVVIGTAFEKELDFFVKSTDLKTAYHV